MKKTVGSATLLLGLAWLPVAGAQAQGRDTTVVGSGIVCNTSSQVARLTILLDHDGANEAMAIVNREASDPKACGIAIIAFQTGKKVADVHNTKGTFEIVEIRIIAAQMADGWHVVSPEQTQYTIVPVKGYDI